MQCLLNKNLIVGKASIDNFINSINKIIALYNKKVRKIYNKY